MENKGMKLPDENQKENNNERDNLEPEEYRFGTGIPLIDQNILSGSDVERAVNGITIAEDRGDDKINKI